MKKVNLVLSMAAGLLGGALLHYVWTQPVHAQSPASAPKEIRSQSFVLEDDKGNVQGVFSFDAGKHGSPTTIKLMDGNGRELWQVGGNGMRLLGSSTNSK